MSRAGRFLFFQFAITRTGRHRNASSRMRRRSCCGPVGRSLHCKKIADPNNTTVCSPRSAIRSPQSTPPPPTFRCVCLHLSSSAAFAVISMFHRDRAFVRSRIFRLALARWPAIVYLALWCPDSGLPEPGLKREVWYGWRLGKRVPRFRLARTNSTADAPP